MKGIIPERLLNAHKITANHRVSEDFFLKSSAIDFEKYAKYEIGKLLLSEIEKKSPVVRNPQQELSALESGLGELRHYQSEVYVFTETELEKFAADLFNTYGFQLVPPTLGVFEE